MSESKSFKDLIREAYSKNVEGAFCGTAAAFKVQEIMDMADEAIKLDIGIEASLVKWDMIRKGELKREEHDSFLCGLCYAMMHGNRTHVPSPGMCKDCPLAGFTGSQCCERGDYSPNQIYEELLRIQEESNENG